MPSRKGDIGPHSVVHRNTWPNTNDLDLPLATMNLPSDVEIDDQGAVCKA